MNTLLKQLKPYPFARLREAMQGISAPEGMEAVPLHIGEPKHPTPKVITDALTASLRELEKYPLTAGLPELRQACANWLKRRYDGLTVNPDNEILPVLGSREALFSFVQTVLNPVSDGLKPVIVSPNPFYQIYEGKVRHFWAAVKSILPIAPRRLSTPIGAVFPKRFGNAPNWCSSARPTTPAAACRIWTDGEKFLIYRINMVSLLPRMNAIPKSILTATNLWAACRPPHSRGEAGKNCLCLPACPSGPMFRACVPVLSPVMRNCLKTFCFTEPITAAQ